MSQGLLESKELELGNVAAGQIRLLKRADRGPLRQWIVPEPDGQHSVKEVAAECLSAVQSAVTEFKPDLIHVWGTEKYWGLIPAGGHLGVPSVLTIQGLKQHVAAHWNAGLTGRERFRMIRLKEILKVLVGKQTRRLFLRWAPAEKKIIEGHRWVICQTPWQAAQVRAHRLDANIFRLDLPLRPEFYHSGAWRCPKAEPRVFCSSAYWPPFKGLHTAIRAVSLLKRKLPGIQLRISGPTPLEGLRCDGYHHWLRSESTRLGVDRQVSWLGPLAADAIVAELLAASAVVIPSFVESYSMAMAEAMRAGTPVVAAFTGGTGYLGRDNESCLFFPAGDTAMCAFQLHRVLTDHQLAMRISQEGRKVAEVRNNSEHIVHRQLEIYRQILSSANNGNQLPRSGLVKV